MDWPCVSCREGPSGKRPYPNSLVIKSSSMKKQGAAKYFITASVIILPLLTNVYTDGNFKSFLATWVAKLLALILQSNLHGQDERARFLVRAVKISQASKIEGFFSGIIVKSYRVFAQPYHITLGLAQIPYMHSLKEHLTPNVFRY